MHSPNSKHALLRCFLVALFVSPGLAARVVHCAEPPITAMVFSPDGNSLLTGSQRGIVEYSWPALNPVREIRCNVGNLHDLAFSPDRRSLAIAGGTPAEVGVVEILSWPELVLQHRIEQHSDLVMAIEWIDDATMLSASLDHQVVICDLPTGSITTQLSGHSKGVTSLSLLRREDLLVSAGVDQNLRVWDFSSGELRRSLNNHTLPVHALALRPGDHSLAMVASASEDKTVRLWQPAIGRMVRFARLTSVPLDVAWLADGSRIVVACEDGRIRMIDPDTVQVTEDLPALNGWAYTLVVHPHDRSLVVGGSDGKLKRIEWKADDSPR